MKRFFYVALKVKISSRFHSNCINKICKNILKNAEKKCYHLGIHENYPCLKMRILFYL